MTDKVIACKQGKSGKTSWLLFLSWETMTGRQDVCLASASGNTVKGQKTTWGHHHKSKLALLCVCSVCTTGQIWSSFTVLLKWHDRWKLPVCRCPWRWEQVAVAESFGNCKALASFQRKSWLITGVAEQIKERGRAKWILTYTLCFTWGEVKWLKLERKQ